MIHYLIGYRISNKLNKKHKQILIKFKKKKMNIIIIKLIYFNKNKINNYCKFVSKMKN